MAHRSQIEDVVPLTDGSTRCILGSIFVNIGLLSTIHLLPMTNKMVPLPLYKINVIAHEAEISNKYCLIADIVNV